MKLKLLIISVLLFLSVSASYSQELVPTKRDTTLLFGTIPEPIPQIQLDPPRHAWGVDLLMSGGGFGLGGFYRHEYSEDLSGFVDFSISEAKDDNEKEFITYYGERFTPGKVNRFLVLPIFLGIEKRLFRDEIVDNFRPYINAAAGPTLLFVFPYNEEYFNALGKGRPKYTMGGYVGLGAFFGSERSSLLGLNLRYYFIPYPGGLESLQNTNMNQFGGFFITLNFGSAW